MKAVTADPGLSEVLRSRQLSTPAFVYSETVLRECLGIARSSATLASCGLLYSLKACPFIEVLRIIADTVDGFGCSSLFEVQLARSLAGPGQTTHFTSPGIRPEEFPILRRRCDYISFNSLAQLRRFGSGAQGRGEYGLRVNPGLSFVVDPRYDPACRQSRLGVPIDDLLSGVDNSELDLSPVTGIHVHNNCDAVDFAPLLQTAHHLASLLPDLLQELSWVNLGGGYLLNEAEDTDNLVKATTLLAHNFGVGVFLEPGAAIVRKSGYLIATVLDTIKIGDETTAVLDTSVNHWPEVFEYQFEPDILGHVEGGAHQYVLAGCTCLAGDLFGTYSFESPLAVGDRVCFAEAGAYSLVKAHYFNGINLPSLWLLTSGGSLISARRFGYEDFRSRYGGVQDHALV